MNRSVLMEKDGVTSNFDIEAVKILRGKGWKVVSEKPAPVEEEEEEEE